MKDKILTAIKAAIGKNSSINDKTLAAYVAIIEDKITDENQISEAIKPYVEVLKEFQGNINSVAAAAASAKETELKANPAVPPVQKTEDGKANGGDDLAALVAAEVAKAVKPIKEENDAFKAKEAASARANLITSKAKELGIPEYRINEGFAIPPDADEVAITAALTTVKQNLVTAGLSSESPLPLTDGKSDFVGLMREIGSKNDKN
jgi:hypothetical protein